MIHLLSQNTNTSLCGIYNKIDIFTNEIPPNRKVSKLCLECKFIYDKNLNEKRIQYINRPIRKKIHDWLFGLSVVGDSDMDLILFPALLISTCGLIIPGKIVAKFLLRLGV